MFPWAPVGPAYRIQRRMHHNRAALCVLRAHIAALFAVWTDWHPGKQRSPHKTSDPGGHAGPLYIARPMSCMPGYSGIINPHTVGSLTIPRASIKWV